MKKLLLGAMMLLSFGAWAQKKAKVDPTAATKDAALNALNNAYEADKKTALQIWDFAEVGYKEVKSACITCATLKRRRLYCTNRCSGYSNCFCSYLW
jgi:aminobenzoyl-glutamate utilization protein B